MLSANSTLKDSCVIDIAQSMPLIRIKMRESNKRYFHMGVDRYKQTLLSRGQRPSLLQADRGQSHIFHPLTARGGNKDCHLLKYKSKLENSLRAYLGEWYVPSSWFGFHTQHSVSQAEKEHICLKSRIYY